MAKKLAELIAMERVDAAPGSAEFNFTVPADVIKAQTARAVAMVNGSAQLPGFRAGKAPAALVLSKYGEYVDEELRNNVFSAAFSKLEEAKLDMLTFAVKDKADIKRDAEAKFTFVVDIAPEINLGDYKNIEVEIPGCEVTDAQVDERVAQYRKMYATYAEVDAPAQAEDMLKADYKSDFELPADADASLKRQVAATDAYIWLSEPEIIPGSIKGLTGAEKGKECTFDAVYPADYREAALAGKTVKYTVTVKTVQRRAELDDKALLERTKSESMEALRDEMRKGLKSEAERKQRDTLGEAIYDKLSALVGDFVIPPATLENETNREVEKIAREQVKSEADAEAFKKDMDTHRAAAKEAASKTCRRNLILRQLAKAENLDVENAEMAGQIEMMSRYYGYKPAQLVKMMRENGAMDDLRFNILTAKALNKLVDEKLKK